MRESLSPAKVTRDVTAVLSIDCFLWAFPGRWGRSWGVAGPWGVILDPPRATHPLEARPQAQRGLRIAIASKIQVFHGLLGATLCVLAGHPASRGQRCPGDRVPALVSRGRSIADHVADDAMLRWQRAIRFVSSSPRLGFLAISFYGISDREADLGRGWLTLMLAVGVCCLLPTNQNFSRPNNLWPLTGCKVFQHRSSETNSNLFYRNLPKLENSRASVPTARDVYAYICTLGILEDLPKLLRRHT